MSGVPFAGGGFFGGGGHVSTQATDTQTRSGTGESYADRGSQSISGVQLQDTASLTLTDQGAIAKAFSFASDALHGAMDSSSKATSAATQAFQDAQQNAGAVNADQLTKLGLGALVLIVGLVVFLGTRK